MRLLPPAVALLALASCRPSESDADLVVFGQVWTGDTARPAARAVAIRGDTVVAVGDSADIARLVGEETEVLANGEGSVTPGFGDAHSHFTDGGFQLISVELRDADSPAEMVHRIQEFGAALPKGEWIVGGNWDHERWAGTPLPRREWLDSVTPDHPVFVQRLDGHMGVANSLALRLAGVSRTTPDVAGGEIVRDPRTGEPTGVLKDGAMNLLYKVIPAPTDAQRDSALARAMAFSASKGITAIGFVSVPFADLGAFQRAKATGRLTVRTNLYFPLEEWRWVADTVAKVGRGDEWLRLDGVKGYVDGSLGSTTALFYAPYDDAPRTSGLLVTREDALRQYIGAADSAGLQVVVHAIGERANGVLLDIFDSVGTAHGARDRRFRIEHAQHLRRQDIGRIARQGVIASMQPYHAIDDGRWAEKRIGPERIRTTYAFRSLLDSGAVLAFGSDWTVAPPDPVLGLYAAVTRRTLDDKHPGGWVPEEKISLEEALRAYTIGHARATMAESRRGILRPGMAADLVLLDRDLFATPDSELANVQVQATVAGGRIVYRR
ncbi:MAG: amidohydrolase [Gemmatimonadales bacterium]